MQQQPDFTLREGATDIKDEQGNLLLSISLSANMVIVRGQDGRKIEQGNKKPPGIHLVAFCLGM